MKKKTPCTTHYPQLQASAELPIHWFRLVSGGVKGSKAGRSGRFFICYQHHSLDAGPLLRTNTHCCLPSDLESLAKTGIVVTSASFHKHPTHGLTGAFRISGSLETTGTARTTTNQHVHRTGIWSSGASWGTPRPSTCPNLLFFQVRLVCFEHLRQQLFTSEHHSIELHLAEVSLDLAYGVYFSLPCRCARSRLPFHINGQRHGSQPRRQQGRHEGHYKGPFVPST